jgi:cysteine desulfurase/selenocysteine lyase
MGASVEMMLEIGPRAIEERVIQLAAMTRDVLRRAGGTLAADYCDTHCESPVLTARFEGRDAGQLVRDLHARKVQVAARKGNLRVSPHFYNDESDLDRFEQELKRIVS